MNNLSLTILLTPVIGLILVIVLYFLLQKKGGGKIAFKKFVLVIAAVAFLLNFGWEMIQMPLYKNTEYNTSGILFCALASVADVIMTLLLYFFFSVIYSNKFWVKYLTVVRVFLLMLAGGLGAVLAEIRHINLGNWAYNDSMPVIPFVNAGLSPVLQFMILPFIIFFIACWLIFRRPKLLF